MTFLADENVPAILTNWIRSGGHDISVAGTIAPGSADAHWLQQAEREGRIILTSDKDFGNLVFRDGLNSHGFILLRLFDLPMSDRLTRLKQVWSVIEANPRGRFIVVTSKKVRERLLKP